MKIDVHVLCKNEIKLAPFFIDYWNALADDVNVYVYDGLSTDGTRELFAKHDNIHVIDFEPDALDDHQHVILKNSCWKNSEADFVMVADFDETIFSYDVETLHNELKYMKESGKTILAPLSFNLIPDTFPIYEKGKYLHEISQYGFNDYVWEAKPILFDPKQIKEINYVHGGHAAHPSGNVKYYISDKLFLIHAKFLGFDFYTERIRNRIISEWNKRHNIDGETYKTFEKLQKEFQTRKDKRFKWNDIKNNFGVYYKNKIDWSLWGGMKIENLIIVSLTSWTKRICNCKTVIESLLNQHIIPDFIELNLSVDEFPNKESDLPNDLIDLISQNKNVEINWVEGNDGVFKKIIPTLKKFYGKEYYLFSVDDDWIYRSDYIELMINYLNNSNTDTFCLAKAKVIGNRQIYKSSCFEPDFWEKITKDVINTRIDDMYIEYYLTCRNKSFSCFRPNDVSDIMKKYNQIFPNSHNTETGAYSADDISKASRIIKSIKFDKPNTKNRIAIFSCMMGGYDIPTDNFEMREGYDYYLFLDKAIHTECWQLMKPMFTNEELSDVKKSRFIKTHPFAVLPDYDIVVWVDANTTIDDKLYDYIDQHKDKPITFKQHPYRDCIYEEIKMCCLLGKETQPMCLKLFERYNGEHFPTHYGLYENNVIIYHPHDPNVQAICNAWWNEIENFSHRDQLSLTYVLWKNNLKDFINVGYSEYFNPKKHLRN